METIAIRGLAIRFAWACALGLACGVASAAAAGGTRGAAWFPGDPRVDRFSWLGEACAGCTPLAPRPQWLAMAALARRVEIRFLLAPDESLGPAWSYAPDVVVLSPSALTLPRCQLDFLIGHELAHIALRHFDEDAHDLLVLTGKPASWTLDGQTALDLLDGDFALTLRMSPIWQQQEQEADWVGSLLAAQACKCSLESGALAYFGKGGDDGGGVAATHDTDAGRIRFLKAFSDSARKLARLP